MSVVPSQADICGRYGSEFVPPAPFEKLGIALATLDQVPLNGVRQRIDGGTCGWYIWGGESLSEDPDFFQPLHVEHMSTRCPDMIPYLALAPGWRVLLASGYADVWYDPEVLET